MVWVRNLVLEEGRGRSVNVAILVIVHRGIEAFAMRSAFQGGEKLLLHVTNINN